MMCSMWDIEDDAEEVPRRARSKAQRLFDYSTIG